MPLNETVIGKQYSAGPFLVDQRDAIYYALATGDHHPAYFIPDSKGATMTPPMFAARYARTPLEPIKRDPETGLDPQHIVHYSQEFHWLAPVHPGDRIVAQAVITHVSTRENGGVLGIRIVATSQDGREVVRATWELFDKSAGREGAGKSDVSPDAGGTIIAESTRNISAIQPYAYAEASGDRNPIHTDDAYARRVGLPGIILHGMCTMAFTHQFAVHALCGAERDPLRLRTLHVGFSRPVSPGDTLTFSCRKRDTPPENGRYGIQVVNQHGKPVLRNAWCAVA